MSGGQVKNPVQIYFSLYFGQVIWQQDKLQFYDLLTPVYTCTTVYIILLMSYMNVHDIVVIKPFVMKTKNFLS